MKHQDKYILKFIIESNSNDWTETFSSRGEDFVCYDLELSKDSTLEICGSKMIAPEINPLIYINAENSDCSQKYELVINEDNEYYQPIREKLKFIYNVAKTREDEEKEIFKDQLVRDIEKWRNGKIKKMKIENIYKTDFLEEAIEVSCSCGCDSKFQFMLLIDDNLKFFHVGYKAIPTTFFQRLKIGLSYAFSDKDLYTHDVILESNQLEEVADFLNKKLKQWEKK